MTNKAATFELSDYLPPSYVVRSLRPRKVLVLDSYPYRMESDHARRRACAPVEAHPAFREAYGWQDGIRFEEEMAYWSLTDEDVFHLGYPRNVPWTHLPVVGSPRWCLGEGMQGWREDRFVPLERCAWDVLSRVEHVVLLCQRRLQYDLSQLDHLQNLVGHAIACHLVQDGVLLPIAQEAMATAELQARAQQRLWWNWNANAGMLMPKLVEQAFRTRRPPGGNMGLRQSWEQLALDALRWNPFSLQLLYWVAQCNPAPIPYSQAHKVGGYPGILTGAGSSRVSCGPVTSLDWTGHLVNADMFERYGTAMTFYGALDHASYLLHHGGLLLADMNRHARLSNAGAALLALLPAGCRDLGMPTRWVDEQGYIGTESDIPAMDRWLTRVLRHIKRAANDLGHDHRDLATEE
jgi:hypothetical protein